MSTNRYRYWGGNIALDFANTVANRLSQKPEELLGSYDDFVVWALGAGILDDREAGVLRRAAERAPEASMTALQQAVDVRELCYRLFEAAMTGKQPVLADVRAFNDHARRVSSEANLLWNNGRLVWQRPGRSSELGYLVEILVRAATELLTSDDAGRISQCQDDRGCGWVFLDRSRSAARRWCSMTDCGNRAKVREHRRRSAVE